ncbi:MAG: ABC transporter ATP-binding protein [Alphaproteobacteria bacterium]|nr:ABC transporter ATP-binding protein [Alphaproteobacteria bacterium]
MSAVVEVRGLDVDAQDESGQAIPIVRGIDFTVARGEVLALIGESGSGKTTIALSLMGYARPGCRIVGGEIRVGDTDIRALDGRSLAAFRGRTVTYVPQSAAAAFNPSRRLIDQVIEGAQIHDLMPRAVAERKAVELFCALALPEPETIGQRFPHQVSGGQLQRLIAAMAMLVDPDLVILDEPTTALDVTTQIDVLRAFKNVVRERGKTAIYVSHDLAVVAQMADRVIVLRGGTIQEQGSTSQLLASPANDYTRSLLRAAAPQARDQQRSAERTADAPLLHVAALTAGYGAVGRDGLPIVPVLRDVDLTIRRGSVLGIIGESGCGKSTLARVIAGLLPPARGTISLDGQALPSRVEQRNRDQLRRVQIVFQVADTALNPAHTVSDILERPLAFYHDLPAPSRRRRIDDLLDMVKLPASIATRHPSELSGGQKQRVNLARALAAKPDLILCDEVTSSLDTVVGAAVLDLLDELRRELGVAYMFISHDVSTIRAISDEVLVLYGGRTVEVGGRQTVLRPPMHPYTDLLLSSVPALRVGWLDTVRASHVADGANIKGGAFASGGCGFRNRCALKLDGTCDTERPPLRVLPGGGRIACHRREDELVSAQGGVAPLVPRALTTS